MSGRKRYRRLVAKPGQIKIEHGKADRYSEPDLCVMWGDGKDMKCTGRLIMNALEQKPMAYKFPTMEIEFRVVSQFQNGSYGMSLASRCTAMLASASGDLSA